MKAQTFLLKASSDDRALGWLLIVEEAYLKYDPLDHKRRPFRPHAFTETGSRDDMRATMALVMRSDVARKMNEIIRVPTYV